MPRRNKGYDRGTSVRRLARQRVGTVPASRPIQPTILRKKPKHKTPPGQEE
jgi:hypothetical protein